MIDAELMSPVLYVIVVVFCSHMSPSPHLSLFFFFLMIRRPPRSTLDRSSAASDVYKRQLVLIATGFYIGNPLAILSGKEASDLYIMGTVRFIHFVAAYILSLIHISEPTRPY